jgi:hypothetical protein
MQSIPQEIYMSLLATVQAKASTAVEKKAKSEGVFSMLNRQEASYLGDYAKRILIDGTEYNRFNYLWLLDAKPKGMTLEAFVNLLSAECKANPDENADDIGALVRHSLDDKGANSSFVSLVRAYNKRETSSILKKNAIVNKPKVNLIKQSK